MKKESKRFFRVAIIIALFCALIAMTASTFAYWDQLTKTREEEVLIGEGTAVTVSVTIPTDKKLIPDGAIKRTNVDGKEDVYFVDFTYEVNLTKVPVGPLDLMVKATNVKIAEDDTHASLVVVSCEESTDVYVAITQWGHIYTDALDGTNVAEITIRVTLNEPADVDQYNAVANEKITFDLTFSAS